MVKIFAILKPIVRLIMKFYGLTPQIIEIEPGTVMKIWAPSKSKAQTKPAIVLVHGFAADGIFSWLSQVLALAGSYAVYVPDLLFFGGSTTDNPGRSTASQAEFVAAGLKKLGVERCTVVGLSYGASIGFKMAKLYPELVESVVASDTVIELTESIWRGGLEKYGYSSLPEFLLPTTVEGLKAFLTIANHKPPSLPDFVARDFLREFYPNRKERAELLEAWVVPDHEVTPISLNQRVYLVWGDDDKIFNSEVAENTKKAVKPDPGMENGWPDYGKFDGDDHLGYGACGYGNVNGVELNYAISRTTSCPPAVAAAICEAAGSDTKGMESGLTEKMSSAGGRESFKKRKADKTHNQKVIEDEGIKEKKIKGCAEDGDSKITTEHNNKKSTTNSNDCTNRETSTDTWKENSKITEVQKPDYIHVRARRGQATDSHSLAERVRREKISERMKYIFIASNILIDCFIFSTQMFPACTSDFPTIGSSSERANPAYFQFNPLQQVVTCCGLDLGINPPDMALTRTISAPCSKC